MDDDRDFLYVPPFFRHGNWGAKQTNYYGSPSSVEEKNKEDKNVQDMMPSFAETYKALEKVKAFFYAHSVTEADREHTLGLKKSYFQLRQNSAMKQKTMYNFFCLKKKWFSGFIISAHSSSVFSTPLKNNKSRLHCISCWLSMNLYWPSYCGRFFNTV
jgi:hypothetical protein